MNEKIKFPEWKGYIQISDKEIDEMIKLHNICCKNNDTERILMRYYLESQMKAQYFKKLILWLQENRDFCICSAHEIFEEIMVYNRKSCKNKDKCNEMIENKLKM